MENYKNSKSSLNHVNKIILSLILLFIGMSSVSAVTQYELLRWEFETGSGSIVFDTSGNNNNGIMQATSWDTNPVKWGAYSQYFDGFNDYISGLTAQDTPNIITISLWLNSQDDNDFYLFEIDDTTETIEVEYDNTLNILKLGYFNNALIYTHFDLENIDITQNRWYHLVFTINNDLDTITYYRDNVLILDNVSVTGGINKETTIKILRLGGNHDGADWLNGNIDSFRIFDSYLNTSQINTLFTTNTITLQVDEPIDNEVNTTNQDIIITSYSPLNNSVVTPNLEILITTNHKADCDLYINNNLMQSYTDITAFSYSLESLLIDNYNYFVYCEYIDNGKLLYDISPYTYFNVTKPEKTIEFYLYDQNNQLLSDYTDLYLVTPCPKSNELNKYFIPETEKYIQNLVNGKASFNLSYDGVYNFCMLKGKVNYKDDTYSINYDFVDVSKQTELGNLFVGNETLTYTLKVEDSDLYQVYEPTFWGKTWASLFEFIFGIIIGGAIILIGVMAGNDKLIIVGGLIIAIGFGVSFTTFVGAII